MAVIDFANSRFSRNPTFTNCILQTSQRSSKSWLGYLNCFYIMDWVRDISNSYFLYEYAVSATNLTSKLSRALARTGTQTRGRCAIIAPRLRPLFESYKPWRNLGLKLFSVVSKFTSFFSISNVCTQTFDCVNNALFSASLR